MTHKPHFGLAALICCLGLSSPPAGAGEVYTGLGATGATLGFGGAIGTAASLRGEYSGGISVARNGQREGLTYDGTLKASRLGGFLDWYPFGGTFRLSGGVTGNDIKVELNGNGGTGTINGKPVNLAGETFKVTVKYKPTSPYLGLGWGHQPGASGLGFFLDLGAQFGEFETAAQTTIVGKFGITQADVDAEVQKVRDNVGRYKVLPAASFGLTYRF